MKVGGGVDQRTLSELDGADIGSFKNCSQFVRIVMTEGV